MNKTKSPFKNYTLEEIKKAESNSFVVLIGNDYYEKNGNFTFSLAQAQKHYEILLKNILITLNDGTPKQKKAALSCLGRLHILPLRLQ